MDNKTYYDPDTKPATVAGANMLPICGATTTVYSKDFSKQFNATCTRLKGHGGTHIDAQKEWKWKEGEDVTLDPDPLREPAKPTKGKTKSDAARAVFGNRG